MNEERREGSTHVLISKHLVQTHPHQDRCNEKKRKRKEKIIKGEVLNLSYHDGGGKEQRKVAW